MKVTAGPIPENFQIFKSEVRLSIMLLLWLSVCYLVGTSERETKTKFHQPTCKHERWKKKKNLERFAIKRRLYSNVWLYMCTKFSFYNYQQTTISLLFIESSVWLLLHIHYKYVCLNGWVGVNSKLHVFSLFNNWYLTLGFHRMTRRFQLGGSK